MRNPNDLYGSPYDSQASSSGVAAFMNQVYLWMFGGLALTGITAMVVSQQPALMQLVSRGMWVIVIAQLVLVFAFSAVASRTNAAVAAIMFLTYSFLTGLLFSVLFFVYTRSSIASTFFITATGFGAMSAYGAITKKSLSGWGSFLFIGLIGLIIAGVVNIFVHSSMLSFVASCAGVLIFAGLTAYDTQKLREMYLNSPTHNASSLAVNGALVLYLDFINLFLYLLRLFGRRRD